MSYPTHFVLIYLPNAISVSLNISTNIRPIYQWLIMGSYKKIGFSHEMGLIDTPLASIFPEKIVTQMLNVNMQKREKKNNG